MQDGSWIRATSESYDRVAERYAEVVADGLAGPALENALLEHFVRDIRRSGGGPVLDAGCGPGVLTRDLASQGLTMVGVDVSTTMLRLARGGDPAIEVLAASLTHVPLRSASAAGVLCWYVLHHVPDEDVPKTMQEIARVMRPGGLLMLGGHVGNGSYIKTEGYGGMPMRVWFVRRSAQQYADLLRKAGLVVEATIELGPEHPATGAVWLARKSKAE